MRKKLSLLMVAFMAVAAFAATVTWKVTADTPSTAGQTLTDDDVVTLKSVFATTRKDKQKQTIAGEDFTSYIQVRVAADPTADTPTGTENTGSTPLVLTAKKDATVTVYYRRQPASGEYTSNDGKDLKVYDQSNNMTVLESEVTLSSLTSDSKYGYVTKKFDVKAGATYTLAARNTTIQFFGLTSEVEDVKEVTTLNFNSLKEEDVTASTLGTNGKIEDLVITDATQGVKMTVSASTGATPNRFWSTNNGLQLRVYGGTLTFEAIEEGKVLTQLTFNNGRWANNTADSGQLTGGAAAVWKGEAQKVVVTIAGNTQLNSIEAVTAKPQDKHFYVTGDFSKWSLENMQQLIWNEDAKAFQTQIQVTGLKDDEVSKFAISDVATVEENDVVAFFKEHCYAVSDDEDEVKIGTETQLALHKGSLYVKENGRYLLSITEDAKLTVTKVLEYVYVTVPAGTDISEAVAQAAEGKFVGDLNVRLYAGDYTITKTLQAGGNVRLYGYNTAKLSRTTIDASQLEGALITLDGTVKQAENADGTENKNYKHISTVYISGVTVNGLKNALVKDNQKTLVDNLTLNNSIVEVSGSNPVFAFTGKGYPAALVINNSTLWSKDGHKGYLLQTGGRVRDLDSNQEAFKQMVYINQSTLYQVAKGQQMNNLTGRGQKSNVFTLTNTLLVDAGSKSGAEVRGWLGGQASTNPEITYNNNTYWTADGKANEKWLSGTGADATGTEIMADPAFADAENGDFTLGEGLVKMFNIGDQRWNNTTYGRYVYILNNNSEVAKGTLKLRVVGEEQEYAEYGSGNRVQSGRTVVAEVEPAEGYTTKDVYVGNDNAEVLKVKENKYAFVVPTTSWNVVMVDYNTILQNDWVAEIADQEWTGEAVEPAVTVTDAHTGDVLEAGRHYEVEYKDNVNPGKATAIIKGLEKFSYTGEITAQFTIVKEAVAESDNADITYRTDDNVTATVLNIKTHENTLTLPATVDGLQIVAIEDGAVKATSLKDIYLPDTEEAISFSEQALLNSGFNHPATLPTVHSPLRLLGAYAGQLETFVNAGKLQSEVKQTAERYWTFSADVDVQLSAGVTAYKVVEQSGEAVEKVALGTSVIRKNQGVLLDGKQGLEVVVKALADADDKADYEGNLLEAVTKATHFAAGEGYYILKGGEFHAVSDEGEVPANKAVLHLSAATAPSLSIIGGEGTTGIRAVTGQTEGTWYDLNGRRLEGQPAQKGVFILNGRKVVVK